MKALIILAATAAVVCSLAQAQMDSMQMGSKAANASPAATTKLTEGEVRKVDVAAGKVTLRHGPIENLGMPGMTMAFKVTETKSLGNLKEGDQVRFRAERVDGSVAVTHIEPAR